MTMKILLLLLVFTLSTIPVAAQTAIEIEQAFGKPILAYTVTEHIWMTPDFNADGEVCRMRFYPRRTDFYGSYLGGNLRLEELKRILNQIVPPARRGKVITIDGLSNIGGGIIQTPYSYEKVTF